jgi:WD40 repeat protein
VCAGATAKKQAWQWRWAGYTHGKAIPYTLLVGGGALVTALATSLSNTMYCGLADSTIQVWSTVTNTHIQTLKGHTREVIALVIGKDGTLYSASGDTTVRIWSGEDGSHLGKVAGHTHGVACLAVGLDDTVYTGSSDTTIRVWASWQDGSRLLRTLEGHNDIVWSIALGTSGKLYSGSADTTVRVWSAVDGSHIGTLEGHTDEVNVVVVAADGTVYSTSSDGILRVWSGRDGSAIRTLQMEEAVWTIAIGAGNTVIIGEGDGLCEGRVSAWNGGAAPARTLYTYTEDVHMLAIGQDGRLFVACDQDFQVSCL